MVYFILRSYFRLPSATFFFLDSLRNLGSSLLYGTNPKRIGEADSGLRLGV